MLHKIIYFIGVKLRSPEILDKYNFLKESESWSIDKLQEYQLQELKKITKIAYDNSKFYRKLFDDVNLSVEDIKSLKDLKKIPCVTKKDILENNKLIQNDKGYRKLFLSETSGSTGEPLKFYRNSEWDAGHRAAQLRGYSWHDIMPWERNGYFWGYSFETKNFYKIKGLDYLLNRFRLFTYNDKEIEKFAKKLETAQYLEGYSSMIYEVAKIINAKQLGPFNLKMIKGTSEKIFDSYQEEVKKAFGKKIISEYGASESGIIAYECKEGNMHIAMENVIVEEEEGEIIVTNLLSHSFPIIRYKLGDSIIIDKETKCNCGMNHYIIKEVTGRIGKVIYGEQNTYPTLTLYYIFKNLALQQGIVINYQAIQEIKGNLRFYLDREITTEIKEKIQKECKQYYGQDIKIEICKELLKRDYSKKFTDFISKVE